MCHARHAFNFSCRQWRERYVYFPKGKQFPSWIGNQKSLDVFMNMWMQRRRCYFVLAWKQRKTATLTQWRWLLVSPVINWVVQGQKLGLFGWNSTFFKNWHFFIYFYLLFLFQLFDLLIFTLFLSTMIGMDLQKLTHWLTLKNVFCNKLFSYEYELQDTYLIFFSVYNAVK